MECILNLLSVDYFDNRKNDNFQGEILIGNNFDIYDLISNTNLIEKLFRVSICSGHKVHQLYVSSKYCFVNIVTVITSTHFFYLLFMRLDKKVNS